MNNIEYAFAQLGRTAKAQFISEHIELASASAVAGYVRGYLFDILRDLDNDSYIIDYLAERGYKTTKRQPDERLQHIDWNNTNFLNEMSVVLVHSYAPKNNFQKRLISMLSPLHGMCVQSSRVSMLSADIMHLAKVLDKKYPRRTTSAYFSVANDVHDLYGQTCKRLYIEDTKGISADDCAVVSIYICPIQGLLCFSNIAGYKNMQAMPFFSDRIPWALEYNQMIDKEGGEQ